METIDGYRKKRHAFNMPGHSHELTFSTFRRQQFLGYRLFCDYFVEAVIQSSQKWQYDVRAFVVMPDHVHLLISPLRREYQIEQTLKSIKQSVARRALNHLRREIPEKLACLATGQKHEPYRFWQDGGGYDRNITSREAFYNSLRYIHFNPVKRGLVERPELWYYSSYRFWAGTGDSPVPGMIERRHLPDSD